MKTYDAVIAGGGLIGASIALELASVGLKVALFDAQKPGREASWASAGMISPSPESAAMSCLLPISLASVAIYPAFIRRVEELSGRPVGYRKDGGLDILLTEEEMKSVPETLALHGASGLRAEALSGAQAYELEPTLTAETRGAILRRDEASL